MRVDGQVVVRAEERHDVEQMDVSPTAELRVLFDGSAHGINEGSGTAMVKVEERMMIARPEMSTGEVAKTLRNALASHRAAMAGVCFVRWAPRDRRTDWCEGCARVLGAFTG